MFDKGERDESKAENEARNIKMLGRNLCKSMMDQGKRGRVDVKQMHQIKMGEYEEICLKEKSEFKRIPCHDVKKPYLSQYHQ